MWAGKKHLADRLAREIDKYQQVIIRIIEQETIKCVSGTYICEGLRLSKKRESGGRMYTEEERQRKW